MREENAKITETILGFEHGVFTCWLMLEYSSGGQGAGGYCLDAPIKDEKGIFVKRQGTGAGLDFIIKILETVGVDRWEELKEKYIRVKSDGQVYEIGNITKNKWFNFKNHFTEEAI